MYCPLTRPSFPATILDFYPILFCLVYLRTWAHSSIVIHLDAIMPRAAIKEQHRKPPGYKPGIMGGVPPHYVPPTTVRTGCNDHEITLIGWPSRGGLIVLGHVTALDFSFFGLDPANPPKRRDENQDAENLFCQQLLWLGATCFDSLARRSFVVKVCDDDDDGDSLEKLDDKEEPDLTLMKRR